MNYCSFYVINSGGPRGGAPLFLDQTEVKKFFWETAPPPPAPAAADLTV